MVKDRTGEYTLVHTDKLLKNPEVVEEKMGGKYIGEFTVRNTMGAWINAPYGLFYNTEPHPEGSNYFVIWVDPVTNKTMVSNGITAVLETTEGTPVEYTGLLNKETKEILYSAYRHDYQVRGNMMIDGGRDYVRHSMDHQLVKFIIENGEIVVDIPE